MTEAALGPLERAQKLAGAASTIAVVAAVLIILGAVGRDIAIPAVRALRDTEVTFDWPGILVLAKVIFVNLILALPSFMLAGALLELGRVLGEYEKGQFFTLKAAAGVRKAGESALWALAFKVLISPTLYDNVMGEHRGVSFHFETFELGLVAFALFVLLMGRVLEAAALIKADNDEIV